MEARSAARAPLDESTLRTAVGALGIFHVLLGRGGRTQPDGRLLFGSADTLTLREANMPQVKAALQKGMLRRGVDLLGGHAGIVATAHTGDDLTHTASAFYETLKEMREAKLL